MAMRTTLSSIFSMLAGLFKGGKPLRRSSVTTRQQLAQLAQLAQSETATKKGGRTKCGGPNWLKIALNSQKRR